MTVQYEDLQGIPFTLPAAPPLTDPPLSLLLEARPLINIEGMVAQRQRAAEQAASAALQLPDDVDDIPDNELDSRQDVDLDLYQQRQEWLGQIETLDTAIKDLQRWEMGFLYLPELSNAKALSLYVLDQIGAGAIGNPTQAALKDIGSNQSPFLWYTPFQAIGRDDRSLFGYPAADLPERQRRSERALRAHEAWQVEREFWTGAKVPTNWHLTASPDSSTTGPLLELSSAFADPTPTPGTVLGVAASLSASLASLDQAIANADGGTGMIHASCYVVQKWAQVYPYLRDPQGNIRTVNNNIIVPGYGYPGTGPDRANRTVPDGVLNSTTTLVSASAAFTDFDIGRPISDEDGEIPAGTIIVSVTNGTTVVMSQAATASESGAHITVSGTGGDATGSVLQWAYATDMQYKCQGDVTYHPVDLREAGPLATVDDSTDVRSERSWGVISNQLLRAAVLVDTGTI